MSRHLKFPLLIASVAALFFSCDQPPTSPANTKADESPSGIRTLRPLATDSLGLPAAFDSIYSIRVQGNVQGRIVLLDSNAQTVESIRIAPGSDSTVLTYYPRSAKPWAIKLVSETAEDTGTYSIHIHRSWTLPVDTFECRGFFCSENGDTIKVGGTGTFRGLTRGDEDETRVFVDSGVAYEVTSRSSSPISIVVWSAPNESFLGMTSVLGSTTSSDTVSSGTVRFHTNKSSFVKIVTAPIRSTDSASYTLSVKRASSSNPDSMDRKDDSIPTLINADSRIHFRTLGIEDVDLFQFPVEKDAIYSVEYFGEIEGEIRVSSMWSTTWSASSGSIPSFLFRAQSTGPETLTVVGNSVSTGHYGLRISTISDFHSDEGEPDNSMASAVAIPTDSMVLNRSMEPLGEDWFKFQIHSGHKYDISIQIGIDVKVDVVDSLKKTLVSSFAYSDNEAWGTLSSDIDGTAYIKVTGPKTTYAPAGQTTSYGPYTISVSESTK